MTGAQMPASARADHLAIAGRIGQGARVLDVGCAEGELMALLVQARGAVARGLEMSEAGVTRAVARGLSVMQGDAGTDLAIYPDNSFDVAIVSKAIQEMRRPADVLAELARIAPDVIVSFRNYGYWRRRLGLLSSGRMPAPTGDKWFAAAALHPCTVVDMVDLARTLGLGVVAMAGVTGGRVGTFRARGLAGLNWRAAEAILHLRRAG